MASNTISNTCANCGKEGSEVTNTCNRCKEVMYCNAACKKKHRQKHKKACDRKVAELHDEKLFKQQPPLDDCPICFLRMPSLTSAQIYMSCCGKVICSGCVHAADVRDKKSASLCPFCRTPPPNTDEEIVQRNKKRVDINDPIAIFDIGGFYAGGKYGLPQNYSKAFEFWYRAAELGHAGAYFNIGFAYNNGISGIEVDMKKAVCYYELAAMQGNVYARNNLGVEEGNAGNMDRALKHYMIAIEGGNKMSLESVKRLYSDGHATKDDYAAALGKFQECVCEIKSKQRDEAAAANSRYKYY